MSIGYVPESYRVVCGGCWDDDPQFARVAYRGSNSPGLRLSYLGFRLMRRCT